MKTANDLVLADEQLQNHAFGFVKAFLRYEDSGSLDEKAQCIKHLQGLRVAAVAYARADYDNVRAVLDAYDCRWQLTLFDPK